MILIRKTKFSREFTGSNNPTPPNGMNEVPPCERIYDGVCDEDIMVTPLLEAEQMIGEQLINNNNNNNNFDSHDYTHPGEVEFGVQNGQHGFDADQDSDGIYDNS